MAKYILQWEVDATRTPEDPKERQQQWLAFQETTKQMIESGQIQDWGEYAGEIDGYCIMEGTEVDVAALTALWVPFVAFSAKPMSIEQAMESIKDLA